MIKNLELDETLGQLLVAEGFSTIDEIKDSGVEDLSKIEGIEQETAKELIERAKRVSFKRSRRNLKKNKRFGFR